MSGAGDSSNQWRPRPRLRELSDIVGAGPSRAETALGSSAAVDAWAAITSTVDNLVGASLPSHSLPAERHAFSRSADHPSLEDEAPPIGSGEEPFKHRRTLEATQFELPHDRSLKSHLRVISKRPLAWAVAPPQHLAYAALQFCAAGSTVESLPKWVLQHLSSDSASEKGLDGRSGYEAEFLFARGLLHCRHPAEALHSAVATQWQFTNSRSASAPFLASDDSEAKSVALSRLDSWQAAFRSLFYGFRYGQVPDFYVLLSTTTVLFSHVDESGDGVHAIISSATPGLVGLLAEQEVPFEKLRVFRAGKKISDSPDPALHSTLAVVGPVNVQALFNFIIEVGPILGNATDVPVLLSDFPFIGCHIASGSVRDQRTTRTDDGSTRDVVQIDGILTRRQFSRLCEALYLRQGADFSVIADSEPRSTALNQNPGATAGCSAERVDATMTLGARVTSRVICSSSSQYGPLVYTKPG
jgi:hypothetical protein